MVNFVPQANLVEVAIDQVAKCRVPLLLQRLLEQFFSELLRLLHLDGQLEDLALLFAVQIIEKLERDRDQLLRVVELIHYRLQLRLVVEIFAQVCVHRFDLEPDLGDAMALGL